MDELLEERKKNILNILNSGIAKLYFLEKDEVKKGIMGQGINNTAGFDLISSSEFKTLCDGFNNIDRQRKTIETMHHNYERFQRNGNLVTDWTNDFMKQETALTNYEDYFDKILNNIAISSLGKSI